jgi:hypothetical protein
VIPPAGSDPQHLARLATIPYLRWRSRSMPDLWDTNPHNAFSTPAEQPDPAPSGHDDDHTKEVRLRDHRGLRPPAYALIALVIALEVVSQRRCSAG